MSQLFSPENKKIVASLTLAHLVCIIRLWLSQFKFSRHFVKTYEGLKIPGTEACVYNISLLPIWAAELRQKLKPDTLIYPAPPPPKKKIHTVGQQIG